MNNTRKTLGAFLCFVLAITAVAGAAGVAAGGSPEDHMMNASENGSNGLNASEIFIMWGGDNDGNISAFGINTSTNQSALRDLENLSSTMELAMMTDVGYDRPVSLGAEWSRNDFEEWYPGGRNISRYPSSANLADSGRGTIKDAHATLFNQEPTTYAYLNGSTPTRYIGSDGTVRGVVDYRIDSPSNTKTSDLRVYRTVEEHKINQTCLLETSSQPSGLDDNPCSSPSTSPLATGPGSHRPELEYSSVAVRQTMNYTLAAEVEATIQITTREKEIVEECEKVNTSDGGYKEVCEDVPVWRTEDVEHRVEEVGVTDTWKATVYDIQAPQSRAVLYPDNTMEVYVLGRLPINGYTFPNGEVVSPWTYYTARNPSWDTITSTNGSNTYSNHSEAHPIRTYAFNSGNDYRGTGNTTGRQPDVVTQVGTSGQQNITSVPNNLAVRAVSEFNLTKSVVVNSPINESWLTGNPPDQPEIQVKPLVRDAGAPAANLSDNSTFVRVRKANLTVKTLDTTDREAKVKVILRDNESGAPIDTSERDNGYVTVSGKKVNTNASGVAVAVIPRSSLGYAKYHSAKWWTIGTKQPYVDAHARFRVGSSILEPSALLQIFMELLMLFGPLLLIAYALNNYWGADTWPPWH